MSTDLTDDDIAQLWAKACEEDRTTAVFVSDFARRVIAEDRNRRASSAAAVTATDAAPVAVDADLDAINKMTDALIAAWSKAEPEHSITRNPVSYTSTFVDMARAALRAVGAKSREPLTEKPTDEAINAAVDAWFDSNSAEDWGSAGFSSRMRAAIRAARGNA